MIGLTTQQAKLLDFIESYMEDRRAAPSFEDMKEAVGLSSKSGIHRLLQGLEERRYIRRWHNRARAIEILRPSDLSRAGSTELVAELRNRGYLVSINPAIPALAA